MPDALVFAALVPRLLGARVLLDLHECMPESFATKYDVDRTHPIVRLLSWLEQRSIAFADHAITCTELQREAFVGRGAARDKIEVVLNPSAAPRSSCSAGPRASSAAPPRSSPPRPALT